MGLEESVSLKNVCNGKGFKFPKGIKYLTKQFIALGEKEKPDKRFYSRSPIGFYYPKGIFKLTNSLMEYIKQKYPKYCTENQ